MTPRIENISTKKLIGLSTKMSVINNKTAQLWGAFAPKISAIANRVSTDKISLQLYPENYFNAFNPNTVFEKWAAVEVVDFENTIEGLSYLILEGGKYAVFEYKGASTDSSIFQYIYSEWLPKSIYKLDNRPHFEVLGEKYKNNDPNSEEEIWIPINEK
ncbi:hypothetical protein GCM10011414_29010 [Croceivirga lutea]|uniref:GyrI-like domain-containing protein n=1 Tax=Croceivirga lutea TaxID=1775167 RepID=UPI00163A5FE1|nr:GyrI-like domain-containing protein [Croceivirga lutea]GGG57366.1 hypothetical protein GCM10011414_29010 [Croceivirga lutea]